MASRQPGSSVPCPLDDRSESPIDFPIPALQLHLAANGDSLADDEITGVSNLTLGGTVQVSGLSSFSGLGQGTWSLIKYSGTLTGNLSALTQTHGLR
jgi:hypothetical protein